MSFKKKYSLLASSAAIAFILAACGADTDNAGTDDAGTTETGDNGDETASEADIPEFPEEVSNEGEAIEGGELRVGIVTDSAIPGVFNTEFSSINVDSQLYGFSNGTLIASDENFQYTDGGAATLELDEETNTVTINLRDDVYWHDGEQVTVDDILFTHEVIGHPDYDGPRYGSDMQNIVGMEAYKAGEADTIEGITVVDDFTLEIEYNSVGPQMLQAGGGVWAYASPRHYLEHLDVTEIESSPEVRENPIGFGPFVVENIVPGEGAQFTAFDDYFLGRPNIDSVVVERVPVSGVVEALNAGEFDFVYNMPVDGYDSFADGIPGYTILGTTGQSYDYIGFNMGTFEDGTSVYDEDRQVSDLALRQAMAHALDIDAVGENFFSGLRFRATSHIVPNFGDYFDDSLEGYPYDPELANQILDEAGYEDVTGDGFREDPNGEPLELTFAARANSDVAEPIALYYLQAWEEIGLNVSLLEGRLHETNAFYDRVQANDPAIDVFEAGWSVGSDPTPDGLYGESAPFNFSRYVSDRNTELIEQMMSQEAFDIEWRVDVFHEWQDYFMNEAAPVIPTFWRTEIQPVNNRVSNYRHFQLPGSDPDVYGLHVIELLAEEPLTE
jgi:peptide/nickel transport system substrate-binding protein